MSVSYLNVSSTQGPFKLVGGEYGVTCHATSYGTVSLQKLAADGSTYITVQSFTADGYANLGLPDGTYQVLVSGASGVYVDVSPIATATY